MLESDYYELVASWARRSLSCFHTKTDVGLRIGRIDVVGLRDVGGNLSGRSELISIEVKPGGAPFLKAVGQAAAYSVYADRCFLADVRSKPFTEVEVCRSPADFRWA